MKTKNIKRLIASAIAAVVFAAIAPKISLWMSPSPLFQEGIKSFGTLTVSFFLASCLLEFVFNRVLKAGAPSNSEK